MVDPNASQSEPSSAGPRGPLLGDHVRIRMGTLAGLVGSIVGFTPACSCIVKIDGLAEGVRVIVAPDVLEPMREHQRAM
jgi:hypothetical protein